MAIALGKAVYREAIIGRDSMERAMAWQGAAGTLFGLSQVYADPGLAVATVTSQVKSTNSAQYLIAGVGKTKAATDNFWTLAGTTVAVSSFQKYALLVDDTGAASVQEATQNTVSLASVSWANVTPLAKAVPQNPWAPLLAMLNQSKCVFGILSIATNSSTTFVPGTTLLGAAGITATFNWSIDPVLLPMIYNDKNLLLGLNF